MSEINVTATEGMGVKAPELGSTANPHSVDVNPTAADVLKASEASEAIVAPEAPAEQPKAEAPKDDRAAAKFAALSKKEREIRQREQAFKNSQKQLDERIKALESREKEFEADWKTNPLEAMKKRGTDYKELTEKYLLQEEPTAEQKQMDYIKGLEQKLEALEKTFKDKEDNTQKQQQEAQVRQAEAAKANYLKNLTEFVNKDPDQYELIAKNDAVGLVYDVMEQIYQDSINQETGEAKYSSSEDYDNLRDIAAKEVENYLLEEAKKILSANKLKSLRTPEPQKPSAPKSATLSNAISQTVSNTGEKFLTDDESKKRAASKLKWIT